MVRPLVYDVKEYVRISKATQAKLKNQARVMGISKGEVLRLIIEHSLDGTPITEVRNVRTKKAADPR